MTLEELQKLLKTYALRPDKKFGQNFLLDDTVLDSMVEAAEVTSTDVVLEVGPGIGNLTRKLALSAAAVLAVEKDTRLQALLRDVSIAHKNVSVAYSDILRFDFAAEIAKLSSIHIGDKLHYKVVANIPYYVTGKIVQIFLRAPLKPSSITVLVQKEVAENIVAKPGRMNLLALSVQLIGVPSLVCKVPAKSFYPAPKVDSAVVHIAIPAEPRYRNVDEKGFFRVARACFAGKRKQIHNTLVNNLALSAEVVDALLSGLHIDRTTRPQELSVETFLALTDAIKKEGLL